jgi:hypothetical protein
MSEPILIVARTGCFGDDDGKHAAAELYLATSEEEAERFCELWDGSERALAEAVGGYPGEAYTASLPMSAAKWILAYEALHAEIVK